MFASMHPANERGFTIVEFMVSIAVGFVVLGVVIALYANMARSNAALTNSSQELQNGSYAMQLLADDLRHAGYYGGAFTASTAGLAALPDPCVTSDMVALRAALSLPVQGYDAPGSTPLTCISASDFVAGTDILVVRRASTVASPPASLDPNTPYLQNNSDWTDGNNPVLNLGIAANFTLLQKDGATPAEVRRYYVHIYYVSPCHWYAAGATGCTAGADGGRPVPTLKMLELGAGSGGSAGLASIALAEGVENLQVDYGIDSTGSGTAQTFLTVPATVADWLNVTEAKVSLLVRNPLATTGYIDAKTYSLGLAPAITPGGAFKRHVFTEHIRLTNVAEFREAP